MLNIVYLSDKNPKSTLSWKILKSFFNKHTDLVNIYEQFEGEINQRADNFTLFVYSGHYEKGSLKLNSHNGNSIKLSDLEWENPSKVGYIFISCDSDEIESFFNGEYDFFMGVKGTLEDTCGETFLNNFLIDFLFFGDIEKAFQRAKVVLKEINEGDSQKLFFLKGQEYAGKRFLSEITVSETTYKSVKNILTLHYGKIVKSMKAGFAEIALQGKFPEPVFDIIKDSKSSKRKLHDIVLNKKTNNVKIFLLWSKESGYGKTILSLIYLFNFYFFSRKFKTVRFIQLKNSSLEDVKSEIGEVDDAFIVLDSIDRGDVIGKKELKEFVEISPSNFFFLTGKKPIYLSLPFFYSLELTKDNYEEIASQLADFYKVNKAFTFLNFPLAYYIAGMGKGESEMNELLKEVTSYLIEEEVENLSDKCDNSSEKIKEQLSFIAFKSLEGDATFEDLKSKESIVKNLIDESEIFEKKDGRVEFSNKNYRDFFIAYYLNNNEVDFSEALLAKLQSTNVFRFYVNIKENFDNKSEISPDLALAIARYSFAVSDKELFDKLYNLLKKPQKKLISPFQALFQYKERVFLPLIKTLANIMLKKREDEKLISEIIPTALNVMAEFFLGEHFSLIINFFSERIAKDDILRRKVSGLKARFASKLGCDEKVKIFLKEKFDNYPKFERDSYRDRVERLLFFSYLYIHTKNEELYEKAKEDYEESLEYFNKRFNDSAHISYLLRDGERLKVFHNYVKNGKEKVAEYEFLKDEPFMNFILFENCLINDEKEKAMEFLKKAISGFERERALFWVFYTRLIYYILERVYFFKKELKRKQLRIAYKEFLKEKRKISKTLNKVFSKLSPPSFTTCFAGMDERSFLEKNFTGFITLDKLFKIRKKGGRIINLSHGYFLLIDFKKIKESKDEFVYSILKTPVF